jgi:hypothetical protein
MKCTYETPLRPGEWNPTRKPANRSSSAMELVVWKWSKYKRGRTPGIGRPHQPSITAATVGKSSGRAGRMATGRTTGSW